MSSCMPDPDWAGAAGAGAQPSQINAAAQESEAFALVTWNVEWLGDLENGPADEARQLALAIDALMFAQADLIALQELASRAAIDALVSALPGYEVAVATYSQKQKVAFLYRRDRLTLIDTHAVEGLDDAGRPPLEVLVRTRGGRELTAIALHAKAGDDPRSHATRASFAAGLAADLERRHAASDVVLMGDWNDRLRGSTLRGLPSPYEPLREGFAMPTAALEAGPERSTVWGETVDHIAVSRSLASAVVSDSVEVLRDELLARHPDFFEAASDHAPVALELRLGAGP